MLPDWRSTESDHDAEATYRIIVKGQLDASWSERLSDMAISVEGNAGSGVTTTLIGPLNDQAALTGVLNTLYDLGLTLICVQHLVELDTPGEV